MLAVSLLAGCASGPSDLGAASTEAALDLGAQLAGPRLGAVAFQTTIVGPDHAINLTLGEKTTAAALVVFDASEVVAWIMLHPSDPPLAPLPPGSARTTAGDGQWIRVDTIDAKHWNTTLTVYALGADSEGQGVWTLDASGADFRGLDVRKGSARYVPPEDWAGSRRVVRQSLYGVAVAEGLRTGWDGREGTFAIYTSGPSVYATGYEHVSIGAKDRAWQSERLLTAGGSVAINGHDDFQPRSVTMASGPGPWTVVVDRRIATSPLSDALLVADIEPFPGLDSPRVI